MVMQLKELFTKLKVIKVGPIIIGLRLKSDLDKYTALKGLKYVENNFPNLFNTRFDEKDRTYYLRNDDPVIDKQCLFTLREYNKIEFAWGSLFNFDFKSELTKFIDSIHKGFEIYQYNIEYIDIKLILSSDWEGQHYELINDAFFSNSSLGSIFESKNILQNDINMRGYLGENRICIINVGSDVKDDEVKNNVFKDDSLKTYIGIAQNFKKEVKLNLVNTFLNHYQFSINFIKDKFIPNIILPIDNELSKRLINEKDKENKWTSMNI